MKIGHVIHGIKKKQLGITKHSIEKVLSDFSGYAKNHKEAEGFLVQLINGSSWCGVDATGCDVLYSKRYNGIIILNTEGGLITGKSTKHHVVTVYYDTNGANKPAYSFYNVYARFNRRAKMQDLEDGCEDFEEVEEKTSNLLCNSDSHGTIDNVSKSTVVDEDLTEFLQDFEQAIRNQVKAEMNLQDAITLKNTIAEKFLAKGDN